MTADAVLNIRLPKDLKAHGNQVLERGGLSVTQVVRNLYEYMEREQTVPKELLSKDEASVFDKRRQSLRKVAGTLKVPKDFSLEDSRRSRILSKHGAI